MPDCWALTAENILFTACNVSEYDDNNLLDLLDSEYEDDIGSYRATNEQNVKSSRY